MTEALTPEAQTVLGQLRVTIYELPGADATPPTWDGTPPAGEPIASYLMNAGAPSSAITIDAGGYRWLGFTVSLPITPDQFVTGQVRAWWEMTAEST